MKNPQYAAAYNRYVAKFDHLKGDSLTAMGKDVQAQVLKTISNTDQPGQGQDGQENDWTSPAQTIKNGAGNVEDISILQYFILRHLGVPDDRLTMVRFDGQQKMSICLFGQEDGACKNNPKWNADYTQAFNGTPAQINSLAYGPNDDGTMDDVNGDGSGNTVLYNAFVLNTAGGNIAAYDVLDDGSFSRDGGQNWSMDAAMGNGTYWQALDQSSWNSTNLGYTFNDEVLPLSPKAIMKLLQSEKAGQIASMSSQIDSYFKESPNSGPGTGADVKEVFAAIGATLVLFLFVALPIGAGLRRARIDDIDRGVTRALNRRNGPSHR